MPEKSSPFRKSWALYAQALAAAWIIGPLFAYFGYYGVQTEETVIVVLGACAIITGPIMVLAAPFMPRPASGPCPLCGSKMYQMFGPQEGGYLHCPRCAAYSKSDGETLSLIPLQTVSDTPVFAAALAWDDIVGESAKTIAFSAQDIVADKLSELITRKQGARVIDKWPLGCCVCGQAANRHEDIAVTVLLKGRAFETSAPVVARAIPYCDKHHKDGVAFGRVEFAASLFDGANAFGIKFRSHATREAFRKLNSHKFDSQPEGPLKVRTPH